MENLNKEVSSETKNDGIVLEQREVPTESAALWTAEWRMIAIWIGASGWEQVAPMVERLSARSPAGGDARAEPTTMAAGQAAAR